jgi:hypothetical protein
MRVDRVNSYEGISPAAKKPESRARNQEPEIKSQKSRSRVKIPILAAKNAAKRLPLVWPGSSGH